MVSRRIILQSVAFLFWISTGIQVQAQQTAWTLGTSIGFALPHRSEMLALVTGHSRGWTLRHGNWSKSGWRKDWSQQGSVWQGVQLDWLNGGSNELGKMASIQWLVALPVRPRWHVELGSGLGWSTAPYDPIKRPLSIAIGTRLNAGIHLGTAVQIVNRGRGWIDASAGLTHFSNGALALPNLGLNNVHLRVCAGWNAKNAFPNRTSEASMHNSEDWRWACAARVGARDINLPGGVLHPTLSASLYFQRSARRTHDWTIALDLAHNQSLQQFSDVPLTTAQRLQLSSLAGINLHFGKGHLMLLQGWVWTHPDDALGRRHLQAVFAYDLNSSWAIELGLRSFRLRADYPFLGMRFRLPS